MDNDGMIVVEGGGYWLVSSGPMDLLSSASFTAIGLGSSTFTAAAFAEGARWAYLSVILSSG